MTDGKAHEIRVAVALKGLEGAQRDYQAAKNRCETLHNQISKLQDDLNRSIQNTARELQEAERTRETLRVEAEIAGQLHEQLKAEQRRFELAAQLQAQGGAPTLEVA
jgi:hypothetical protein